MEGIKEFLESSTIHGLTYISTIRTPFIKLFWIGVVVGGFVTASILINRSFTDWEKSPIATTTETFPISKSIFPRITVCPPKRSITPLNYGYLKAENATLDNDTRHELMQLTRDLFDEGMSNDALAEDNRFEEDDKSNKLYEGYSRVTLAYENNFGYQLYNLATSATSGNLSTPWFGHQYTKERFEMLVNYKFYVHFPTKMSTMSRNLYLVVVMMADTKKTDGGEEHVSITIPGGSDEETIQYTGKLSKTWRCKVTNQFAYHNMLTIA